MKSPIPSGAQSLSARPAGGSFRTALWCTALLIMTAGCSDCSPCPGASTQLAVNTAALRAGLWVVGGERTHIQCVLGKESVNLEKPADAVFFTSTDGAHWVRNEVAEAGGVSAMAFGSGRFVAVTSGGVQPMRSKLLTSVDGLQWDVAQSREDGSRFHSIAFVHDRFVVAVTTATDNAVVVSTDGVTWQEPVPFGSALWYEPIVVGGQGFSIVVGDGSALAQSSDGLNWSFAELTGVNTISAATWTGELAILSGAFDGSFGEDPSLIRNAFLRISPDSDAGIRVLTEDAPLVTAFLLDTPAGVVFADGQVAVDKSQLGQRTPRVPLGTILGGAAHDNVVLLAGFTEGIALSQDGGETFQKLSIPPPE